MEFGQDAVSYRQAVQVLPVSLRREALALPPEEWGQVEELRLRIGWPMSAVFSGGERALGGLPITVHELDQLLELASRASVHAVMEQLRRGYLTIEGGHRVGLCGSAVMRDGEIHTLRRLSSASIRVARSVPGAARPLLTRLAGDEPIASTLILAPPGLGKTTLLRDLIRCVSDGDGTLPRRVGVVDERGELAALWNGRPQLELGRRTDVVEGCPKAKGLMLMLRSMNPQVLAVDEITAPEDVAALVSAAGCGVTLLATAHGDSREELAARPLYRSLLEEHIFQRLVRIRWTEAGRHYDIEELP